MAYRYWRPVGSHGVDLLRWDASTHRYARHSHEGYALGVVEAGAHAFTAHGRAWTAIPGQIIVVNPEEAHDGRPAERDAWYSYRMLYVDGAVVATAVAEAVGRRVTRPYFADAVVSDAALSERLLAVHRALERPVAKLESETLLLSALTALAQRHGCVPIGVAPQRRTASEIAIALDYLREHFMHDCSLADLAALAGVDRFHLLRAFRRALGLPPHQYQTQLRLRHAKALMLAGESPVRAAAAAGFADQSHLIRKFKSAYGVTPGAYLGRHAQ
jgi:AraC-like DNA-binding protein